ncbi:MAG: replication-associated recombination protein A [Gammaproteobacteria bacterium]|nr:replication-associated recombination protein A [Gammaproteobacteria bacterium]
MNEPTLFSDFATGVGSGGSRGAGPAGRDVRPGRASTAAARAPLAARMRPRTLAEFAGQARLLEDGSPLRRMLEGGALSSLILWGPPGSGKTTLARLLARRGDAAFVAFSAVTEGVARVRAIIAEARERIAATGRGTILFCDEIHRFNKAQQDAFLPFVEEGVVCLVGATTENPSFEVIRPLLSRAPVFVLEPLSAEELTDILRRALEDGERGLGRGPEDACAGVLDWIAGRADGDARRALGVLERAGDLAGAGRAITLEHARQAAQHRFSHFDKAGEEHYNTISALHKAVRGSDPDGALYWLARMLQGGQDPLYIARRLVRMASEDIGLADPRALAVALAGRDAFHFLGSPEGELALAEVVVYLASAPKSNRLYRAWLDAGQAARQTPGAPVPLHLRNAPTDMMKQLGYGAGYQYDPDAPQGVAAQSYLPGELDGRRFYAPGTAGEEQSIAARLERFRALRTRASSRGEERGSKPPPASGT